MPPGAAAIMPATGAAAPSSAVVPRSHAGPNQQPAERVRSPPSSDSILGLDRLSPMNGSVNGRKRRSVYDNNLRVLYENVRVSGANEVRVPEDLMDVGDG